MSLSCFILQVISFSIQLYWFVCHDFCLFVYNGWLFVFTSFDLFFDSLTKNKNKKIVDPLHFSLKTISLSWQYNICNLCIISCIQQIKNWSSLKCSKLLSSDITINRKYFWKMDYLFKITENIFFLFQSTIDLVNVNIIKRMKVNILLPNQ